MKRFQILFLSCLVLSFTFSIFAQDKDTKEVIILQTSDVHSRIEPVNQKGDEYYNKGGFLRRAAFLEQFRKEHKNVLLFDCGDISQGTPYYNMFRGEVEVKLMNEMGYDAMTIGNHEFDFDVDNMERIFKMANFPVVCANYNLDATVLKDIVKPYVVLEKYGLRIGINFDLYLDEMAQSKDSFRKLIQNERRLEFTFENHRYFDMRRWVLPLNEEVEGVAVTRNEDGTFSFKVQKVEQRKYEVKNYFMPLPYAELEKNKNLMNNQGWE